MPPSKTCGVCAQTKPDTTEYFSPYTMPSGKPSRRGTCKPCMSERAKRHHRERPDLRKASLDRRRDRRRGAKGSHTNADIAQLKRKLKGKCFYCGVVLQANCTVDHMTPLSRGGTNWPSNLTLACKTCNFDKHAKTAKQFVEWRVNHALRSTLGARALLGPRK